MLTHRLLSNGAGTNRLRKSYTFICVNMFILFQLSFKNVAKWCKITLVTKRTLKKLVWRLVATHEVTRTHWLDLPQAFLVLVTQGWARREVKHQGRASEEVIQGWVSEENTQARASEEVKYQARGHQVLESEGEYDACLSHPRVGNRGLGRGSSGADVTRAELSLRLATGLFRWIFFLPPQGAVLMIIVTLSE